MNRSSKSEPIFQWIHSNKIGLIKAAGICLVGGFIFLAGTKYSGGRTGSGGLRKYTHLKIATNPATLFKTDTWYQAYDSDGLTTLSKVGSVLFGKKTDSKTCTLTFDDGPHPLYTPQLVSTLNRLHVPATFFVIGKQVDRFPYLVQLEADHGFEIGNHSYSHVTLTKLHRHDLLTEFKACDLAIENAGGTHPHYCRPPGGDVNWETVRAAATYGMKVVLWSDDPGDYAINNPRVIANSVIKHIRDGAIILLHDGNEATIEALPEIVNWAKHHGYKFVPLKDIPSTKI